MIGELLAGVSLLGRGFGLVLSRRRLFVLGAIPPLITSVIFLVLLITLLGSLDTLVPTLAGFADSWPSWLELTTEIAIGIGLVGGSVLIMVLLFTSITLLVGGPAYDKIAERVEEDLDLLSSAAPEARAPSVAPERAPSVAPEARAASIVRAIRQSLALLGVSLLGTIAFGLAGFVPVVGQTVVPVLATIFGSWLLCLELLAPAFDRRGLRRIADRRRAMQGHRLRTLGFAVPTFLLLAIPFVSVLVFPAATAGGVLLAGDLDDGPVSRR